MVDDRKFLDGLWWFVNFLNQVKVILFCFVCLFVFVVPNEEGMDITMAHSEPMLSRSDVGDEQELSEIEKKVLDGDSTGVALSLDGPECSSHDTEPATTPGYGEWYNAITHLWNLSALKLADAM